MPSPADPSWAWIKNDSRRTSCGPSAVPFCFALSFLFRSGPADSLVSVVPADAEPDLDKLLTIKGDRALFLSSLSRLRVRSPLVPAYGQAVKGKTEAFPLAVWFVSLVLRVHGPVPLSPFVFAI